VIRTGFTALAFASLVACGDDGPPTFADSGSDSDAASDPDAATGPDAGPDADPDAATGFGTITGQCGVVTDTVLDAMMPAWFQGELTLGDRYDDPVDRPRLTLGGVEIILDDNAGGSSLYSEVFAFEWLARCEGATLLKTETEIVYDIDGKKADLLVELRGRKIGVSVVRAVTFPFGDPYEPLAATTILTRKLDDLAVATTQVSAVDQWSEQAVAALAYDAQHAQVLMDAWEALTPEVRRETVLVVAVTSGDDLFIYTDQ
jgi:hypothetical protein